MDTKWKFRKVENLWLDDKAQRECQWQHLWLRDISRYERQWQHLCLRGISQYVHPQPLALSVVRILSGGVVLSSSAHTHALWLRIESFMSSPWPSTCVRSLRLDPPFLFLALPSAPFPLPRLPEVCGKPAQLLQREYGPLLTSSPSPQFANGRYIRIGFMGHSRWCAGARCPDLMRTRKHKRNVKRETVNGLMRTSITCHLTHTFPADEHRKNESVIKMIIDGRSSNNMYLHWVCEQINLDQVIQINCVNINQQIADAFTKGSFSEDRRGQLMDLCLDWWHTHYILALSLAGCFVCLFA